MKGTENEMKKIILILLAMSILLYGVAALAENRSKLGNLGEPKEETESEEASAELNWADMEAMIDLVDLDGGFYRYPGLDFRVWIPGTLQQTQITEEQVDRSWIDFFTDESEDCAIVIQLDYLGMPLEQLKATAESEYSGVSLLKINGRDALVYFQNDDAMSVVFPAEDGYFVMLTYGGITDQDFMAAAAISMASLQADEA